MNPQRSTHHDRHRHAGVFGQNTELIFTAIAAVATVFGLLIDRGALWSDQGLLNQSNSHWYYIAAMIAVGWFIGAEILANLGRGRFEIDGLMMVAAIGAGFLAEWFEAALLLVLFAVGHSLEEYALGRARRSIDALAELTPSTAWVRRDDELIEVDASSLNLNAVIIVKPTQRFPTDGFVLKGASTVNEAPVTGEAMPIDKVAVSDPIVSAANPDQVGAESRIFAGSLNGAAVLEVQTTRHAQDSTIARIRDLVAQAETEVAPTQRHTESFERIFVPIVICLAVVIAVVVPPISDWSWSTGFYRSMAVLVAASPCALAISTPAAILSGIARAARNRILIKGGAALEQLGQLRSIAFDKTGTLTKGQPRIAELIVSPTSTDQELLQIAVSVEKLSDHPLAKAIVADAMSRLLESPEMKATDLVSLSGRGVVAKIHGEPVYIGNRSLFAERFPVALPNEVDVALSDLHARGHTTVIVAYGTRYLGTIALMDTPRPEAATVIRALKDTGITHIAMLSGDSTATTTVIAEQLGIDTSIGDLLPEEKLAQLRLLRDRYGSVAMIGDGVNDAPAMASAAVGIAMGAAGSDVALETSDIALMTEDLRAIPFVVALSRATRRTIGQNLLVSVGIVALLVPLTIAGLDIGPAVIAHEGSTLVVAANSLRLLRFNRPGATL